MKKRIIAMLMAAALCVSSVPFSVWAEETEIDSSSTSVELAENDADQPALEESVQEEITATEADQSEEITEEPSQGNGSEETNTSFDTEVAEESALDDVEVITEEKQDEETTPAIISEETETVSKEAMQASSYNLSNPRTEAITNSDGQDDLKTTWDCVYFGNYPQSDSTGATKEPIKWRVLSVNGNDAFLLADKNLDRKPYNTEYKSVTWETCTLRAWLNNDFYNSAFNSNEQSAINTTTVVNDDNPEYGTIGGNNTQDKVYLLSISEALNESYGFPNNYSVYSVTRWAKNTAYAKARGAFTYTGDAAYSGNGRCWLRSPGSYSSNAAYVNGYGVVFRDGGIVICYDIAVRPALHLNLSSSSWTYAGTVSSDGDGSGSETPITDTDRKSFEIKLDKSTYSYKGEPVIPELTVRGYKTNEDGTEEDVDITEGTDYTISYKNNNLGSPESGMDTVTATVTVTGKGDFQGCSVEKEFTIKYQELGLDYLEVDFGGNVTVHWFYNGDADAISGFEVQHRWKNSDGLRTTKVSGSSKREVDIVNLSYNEYEFRVRAVNSEGEQADDAGWSDWAECPVQEIRILSPESGSSNVDSFGFTGKIDFGTNVCTHKEYEVGVYEKGKTDSPEIRIPFELNYDSSLTLRSDVLVFIHNSEHSQNPSAIAKLDAGKKYHVAIDEKAVEYVNEDFNRFNEEVPVYFAGINKTDTETWGFSTINVSYPGLENPGKESHHSIPEKYYQLLFKEQDWKDIQAKDDGSGGICFGLCYTAGANKAGYSYIKKIVSDNLNLPDISSHTGYARLSDVPIGENSKLLEYVRMAHLFQYRSEYNKIDRSKTKLSSLYETIKEGNNTIISIKKSDNKNEGHVVFSPGVLSGGDSKPISIPVYDSARGSSESFVKTLTLSSDLKRMEPFGEYDTYNWYYEIDPEIDKKIEDSINSWDYNLLSYEDRLMTSTKELEEQDNIAPMFSENGTSENEGLYYYWLEGSSYHIDSVSEKTTVTLSDGENKIYTTIDAGQSATLDIENKLVTIDGVNAGGKAGEYEVRFSTAEDYNTFHDTVIKGTSGAKETTLTKTEDGISVETDGDATITVSKEENEKETASTTVKLTDGSAQIKSDGNSNINVYEDRNGDGNYTDLVKPVVEQNETNTGTNQNNKNKTQNNTKNGVSSGTDAKIKATNPIRVKGKTVKVKYSKLKKKKQSIKASKAFAVSKAQGKVTYKLASVKKAKFKKYFKVSSSGKITIKKGLKKGTYKVKVKVIAAGNSNYLPATKTVTLKIRVK